MPSTATPPASGATIVVSASMPIRDLEWFAAAEAVPPRVLANRGANGIDGVVSTALGVAASESDRDGAIAPIALLGDLAFLHDVSGLVNLPAIPCTFVVVDNGGGGIFSFLPQATSIEAGVFERLFGTPPTSDIGAVARGFGLPVHDGDLVVRTGAGARRAGSCPGAGEGAGASAKTSPCTTRSTRRSVSR